MTDWITSEDNDALFIEFVYILGPKSLIVLEHYATDEKVTRTRFDGVEYQETKYAHRFLNAIPYSDTLVSI
jgi:hypothetical protein